LFVLLRLAALLVMILLAGCLLFMPRLFWFIVDGVAFFVVCLVLIVLDYFWCLLVAGLLCLVAF